MNVATAPTMPALLRSDPGDDAARVDGRAERAALHLRAQRLEQRLAACVTPPVITTTSGLRMLSRFADAGAEKSRGVAHDLERERVAGVARLRRPSRR